MAWPALFFRVVYFPFMVFVNMRIHARLRPNHALFIVCCCIETKPKVQQTTCTQQSDDYSVLFISHTCHNTLHGAGKKLQTHILSLLRNYICRQRIAQSLKGTNSCHTKDPFHIRMKISVQVEKCIFYMYIKSCTQQSLGYEDIDELVQVLSEK